VPPGGSRGGIQGIWNDAKKHPTVADAVVLAVPHDFYLKSGWPLITRLLKDGQGLVMDVKGVLSLLERPPGIEVWRL